MPLRLRSARTARYGEDMFKFIRRIDNKIVDRITVLDCKFMDKLMIMSTYAGTGAFVWWITLALPFVLSRSYRKTGVILIIVLGVNYLLGEIVIKRIVRRERPSALLPEEEMKITKPKDHSFPSGHSASSFCAFAVVMLSCRPFIWIPSLVVASIIAFSRLYLRVHYLSDVICGIALGMLDGTAVTVLFRDVVFRGLAF